MQACIRHFETSGYICFSYCAGKDTGKDSSPVTVTREETVSEPSSRLWVKTNLALTLSFEFLSWPSCEITLINITMRIRRNRTQLGTSGTETLQGRWSPFSVLGSYNKYVAGLHKIKREERLIWHSWHASQLLVQVGRDRSFLFRIFLEHPLWSTPRPGLHHPESTAAVGVFLTGPWF